MNEVRSARVGTELANPRRRSRWSRDSSGSEEITLDRERSIEPCKRTSAAWVRGGNPDREKVGRAGPERTESTLAALPKAAWAVAVAAFLAPALARAAESSGPQIVTVLGLRVPDGPPVADLTAQFRKALAQQVAAGADLSVPSEAETRASLGVPTARTSALLDRIGDAESDYQQLLLDQARRKFEEGLQDLAQVGGEEGVWESTVTARLLLGMVHLATQARDASNKARGEFEAILRVDPTFQPTKQSNDPVVLALFEKARAKLSREPTGQLAVSCQTPCPQGFVWVDAAPSGPVNGAAIKLPAGSYRVRITDRRDSPRLRSFTHEVQVNASADTRLMVDLESEGALDLAGGPAFAAPADNEHRLKVLQLTAQRVRKGKIAAVWLDPQYVHLAIADASSARIERHAAVPAPADGRLDTACLELARFAAGSLPPPASVLPLPPAFDAIPAPPPAPSAGARPLAIAKWSALGATAALGIAGAVVAASADSDRGDLQDLLKNWGGAPTTREQAAQVADATASLRSKQGWRNGLFIGAGVAAAATAALFVFDALHEGGSARPEIRAPEARPPEVNLPEAPRPPKISFQVRPAGLAILF
jgi:hypothetical protein